MRGKVHPAEPPRRVRDPRDCQVQSGGRLVYLRNGRPEFFTDRPFKFPGRIKRELTARDGVKLEDIKWRQLNGRAWYRLPEYPSGSVEVERR